MKRSPVLLLIALVIMVRGIIAEAQQPKKVPRIGILKTGVPSDINVAAFRQGLRDLGYIEGQNVIFEYRWADRDEHLPDLAAELVRLRVDVIVTGASEAFAAKESTKTIPIVLGTSQAPVETGLVASLAHPGRNITGTSMFAPELWPKRLELLKEAIPKLARVAVFYNPTGRSTVAEVKEEIPIAGRALGLTIQTYGARDTADLEKVLTGLSKDRPDGLYMPGGVVRPAIERVINFALKSRLPSMYAYPQAVEVGGLVSYSAEEAERYRRVAYFVDRILKGTKPADLPVEQPKKFELVINLQTAKQIGLTIPPNVLARADRVIK